MPIFAYYFPKIMRRRLLYFLLAMLVSSLSAQQSKQVYITLDVSGSMGGNKYVLANYTTQMIVTLCDPDDDIHMIVYGQEKILSKEKNPLASIQYPMHSLSFGKSRSRTSQFDDIIGFNRVYRPSEQQQNWLFIIGDGYWNTYSTSYAKDLKQFEDCVKGGGLNVCYLQTCEKMEEHTDFTKFLETLGVVDIGKSSLDTKTIQAGCDHFARKILGFSEASLDIKKSGSKVIKIVAELPVSEFLLVYQDEVTPDRLPSLANAHFNGTKLDIRHKGTPTTRPVKSGFKDKDLSGNVWRLKADKAIPAKTEIIVEFDKEVDAKNVSIYPLVKEIEFGSVGLTRIGGELKQVDDKTFSICRDENTALVRIELNEDCKENLPEELLKKTKVVVKANNKEYKAKYNNGGFECTIDLKDEKTQYYAECDCPGYFNRVTPIMTIVKGDCQPAEPPTPAIDRRETVDFGTITFDRLMKEPIAGVMQDAKTLETLDPQNFDITVEIEDGFMYEEPKLSIKGDTLIIDVHPRGDWCECLFPTDLDINIVSSPKPGAFEANDRHYVQTVHPVHLKIEKERPWLVRCFWVVATLIALLLLLVYLRALMKKNRFKKNAMVTPRYYSYYGDLIDDQGGRRLRKEGFGAWFARWLLPMDERTTLYVDKPAIGSLTLIASASKEVVRIPKSCCDWETMDISGYDPESDTGKSKTVSLGDMGSIEITAPNGSRDGDLIFTSGSENDGAGYKLFLSLLMVASTIAIVVLIWLMLKSF